MTTVWAAGNWALTAFLAGMLVGAVIVTISRRP